MLSDSVLHIVYATDRRYLFPTQVAAGSAIAWASCRKNICIDILDCGVPDQDWQRFSTELRGRFGNAFELKRHIVKISRFDAYPSWHHSKGLYARFEIPRFLKDVDWCVYCDGDTLFTDDPLKLQAFFDDRYALWGHKDDFDGKQRRWHEDHQLPFDDDKRVCSGFLIMNLKWFRENDSAEFCLKFVESYPDVVFPDQDALNYVCRGKIGLLPDCWGKFTYLVNRETEKGCFHYVAARPWELNRKGRLTMDSAQKIWFSSMRNIVGMSPWRSNRSYLIYIWQCIKTSVWLTIYRVANHAPCVKGRYDNLQNIFWPKSKMLTFVAKVD